MVIRKIFEGVFDEEVHSDFLKFGRGEYKDKYLLEGKKQAGKWSVKTGPEFVNFLVEKCLRKVSGDIEVKGIIVSTVDLRDEVDFDIVKAGNFQGIRKLTINTLVDVSKILDLMEKHPRAFFALSFKGDSFVLRVKAKAPKSGKPGKEGEDGPKAEFCSLKTSDREILRELFFDISEFKEVKVNHLIRIEEIVYPSDIDNLSPAEVREKSKRKGVIERRVVVDGVEKVSEAGFVV